MTDQIFSDLIKLILQLILIGAAGGAVGVHGHPELGDGNRRPESIARNGMGYSKFRAIGARDGGRTDVQVAQARAVAGGLTIFTLITLVLVPAVYSLLLLHPAGI